MKTFVVYAVGLVCISVCTDIQDRDEIERKANEVQPTGISSRWKISEEKKFRGGESMPCACEEDPSRMHWLLNC